MTNTKEMAVIGVDHRYLTNEIGNTVDVAKVMTEEYHRPNLYSEYIGQCGTEVPGYIVIEKAVAEKFLSACENCDWETDKVERPMHDYNFGVWTLRVNYKGDADDIRGADDKMEKLMDQIEEKVESLGPILTNMLTDLDENLSAYVAP